MLAVAPSERRAEHGSSGGVYGSTTQRYYDHLERRVLAADARATEEAIARASNNVTRVRGG